MSMFLKKITNFGRWGAAIFFWLSGVFFIFFACIALLYEVYSIGHAVEVVIAGLILILLGIVVWRRKIVWQ